MEGKTVPVSSVPMALVERLDGLTLEVSARVMEPVAPRVDRSMICRLAIEDLIERYESDPGALADRLGFRLKEAPSQL